MSLGTSETLNSLRDLGRWCQRNNGTTERGVLGVLDVPDVLCVLDVICVLDVLDVLGVTDNQPRHSEEGHP